MLYQSLNISYEDIQDLVRERDGNGAANNAWALSENELRDLLRDKYPNIDEIFDYNNAVSAIRITMRQRGLLSVTEKEITDHLNILVGDYGLDLQTASLLTKKKIYKDHIKGTYFPTLEDIKSTTQKQRYTINVTMTGETISNSQDISQIGLVADREAEMPVVVLKNANAPNMCIRKKYRLRNVTTIFSKEPQLVVDEESVIEPLYPFPSTK